MLYNSYITKYKEYSDRHGGSPKHSFSHFLIVYSKWEHHREFIRSKITWWQETNKLEGKPNIWVNRPVNKLSNWTKIKHFINKYV
jgi:hypothetical protein